MEQVARARLADELATGARLVREVPAVPGGAARVVAVEVAHLLPRGARDRRVLAQVGVERSSPGLLRAEDQEVRQRAGERGDAAVRPDRVAEHRANGVRQRRDELGETAQRAAR